MPTAGQPIRIQIPTSEINSAVRQAIRWEFRKRAEIRRLIARTAYDIERDAIALCPVDTGRLRSSITVALGKLKDLYAEVGTEVNYAEFVELGTRRMHAQPFLRPAVDKHVPIFLAALRQIMES